MPDRPVQLIAGDCFYDFTHGSSSVYHRWEITSVSGTAVSAKYRKLKAKSASTKKFWIRIDNDPYMGNILSISGRVITLELTKSGTSNSFKFNLTLDNTAPKKDNWERIQGLTARSIFAQVILFILNLLRKINILTTLPDPTNDPMHREGDAEGPHPLTGLGGGVFERFSSDIILANTLQIEERDGGGVVNPFATDGPTNSAGDNIYKVSDGSAIGFVVYGDGIAPSRIRITADPAKQYSATYVRAYPDD